MSTRIEEEAHAKRYLSVRGYCVEPPDWLDTGKGKLKPEFWAVGPDLSPAEAWIEVKSTDEAPVIAVLQRHFDLVKASTVPAGLCGYANLSIAPGAAKQSVERVLKRFAIEAPKFASERTILAFTQQLHDRTDLSYVEVKADPPERIWTFGAGSGKLHPPMMFCEDRSAASHAKCIRPNGVEINGRAFDFFDWLGDSECALVVRLDPTASALTTINPSAFGTPDTRERTAGALKKANKQIRFGCDSFRNAPGVVILVPQDPHAADDLIAQACYGDMLFEVGTHAVHYRGNGVFGPQRNTHTSVVIRLWPGGAATYFPNFHALSPIDEASPMLRGATKFLRLDRVSGLQP
jgi:hypothetical protein